MSYVFRCPIFHSSSSFRTPFAEGEEEEEDSPYLAISCFDVFFLTLPSEQTSHSRYWEGKEMATADEAEERAQTMTEMRTEILSSRGRRGDLGSRDWVSQFGRRLA